MFATISEPPYGSVGGRWKGESVGRPFVVLEAHLEVFDQLLRYHDPVLATFMEGCGMGPDAYATPWWVACVCLCT